jgi:NAD+ synthase
MMLLYDTAKSKKALVCGTENRSEHLLGYYTRFGDEASDLEPIKHLYKTQIYQLADFLKIPQQIIDKKPSAGLWPGQTDSDELGFTYEEADPVLHLYFDKNKSLKEIKLPKTKKIIMCVKKNKFKKAVPYCL